MKYYAVRKGRCPGIYTSWDDCKAQIHKFPGAKYKSFDSRYDAENYMGIEEKVPEGTAYAFVDGSFNSIGTGVYGYGGFLVDGDNRYTLTGCGYNEKTAKIRNVAGELMGAIAAINKAIELELPALLIYYDYEGIAAWANGEWAAKNATTVYYAKFVRNARSKIDLYFNHVKAHTGIAGNEEADYLAKRAVGLIEDSITPVQEKEYSIEEDIILSRLEYWDNREKMLRRNNKENDAAAAAIAKREVLNIAIQLGIFSKSEATAIYQAMAS